MASRFGGLLRSTPHQLRSRALVEMLLYRALMVPITIGVALFFRGSAARR